MITTEALRLRDDLTPGQKEAILDILMRLGNRDEGYLSCSEIASESGKAQSLYSSALRTCRIHRVLDFKGRGRLGTLVRILDRDTLTAAVA